MEHIGPYFGVFLLMNNYFHDVATALLAASGLVLKVMTGRYRDAIAAGADEEARAYFTRLLGGMRSLARFSLLWILVGALPRTLFYRDFEWINAVEHGQALALILKHMMAFFFVGLGAWLWWRARTELEDLSKQPTQG